MTPEERASKVFESDAFLNFTKATFAHEDELVKLVAEQIRQAVFEEHMACVKYLEAEAMNYVGDDEDGQGWGAAIWQALTSAAAAIRTRSETR